jgi:hypothetical protein
MISIFFVYSLKKNECATWTLALDYSVLVRHLDLHKVSRVEMSEHWQCHHILMVVNVGRGVLTSDRRTSSRVQ